MFVAWRDLRFAWGRFALMGTVIVLITVLVGLVSGLTAGLARASTSAITGLPADHLVFAAPGQGESVSFTTSTVDARTARAWRDVDGVTSVQPLSIAAARAEAEHSSGSVTAFGVPAHSRLAPAADSLDSATVVLSDGAADELGAAAGDTIRLGGVRLRVAAVSGDDSFSHTPVVWMTLRSFDRVTGSGGSASVLALTTDSNARLAAADAELGTRTVSIDDALPAIGSYTAENGSLQLMRGFLFVISALVIGAFFTVWTIQRTGDVAVLKALGASTPYLLRDALGQAAVLLVLGTALGLGITTGLGILVAGSVPFVLSLATVLVPALALVVLGLLGAALSIRRITSVDPLTALGSAR